MADGTGASPEQMRAFSTAASNASSSLQQVFATLAGDLAQLEAASQGQFATAFAQVKETVRVESDTMYRALDSIAQDVGTAGVAYTNADDEQKSMMTQVSSATSGITSGLSR